MSVCRFLPLWLIRLVFWTLLELQSQCSAGSVKSCSPPGGRGVWKNGRKLPGGAHGHRRIPDQLHGEENGEEPHAQLSGHDNADASFSLSPKGIRTHECTRRLKEKGALTAFVLWNSFATAEEPKRKSCSSPSTHMDSSLRATRTQGTTQTHRLQPYSAERIKAVELGDALPCFTFFLLVTHGRQVWCSLSRLLPTEKDKDIWGDRKHTESTIVTLLKRKMEMREVGWDQKEEKFSVPKGGLKKTGNWMEEISPQEVGTGRMCDTPPSFLLPHY